MLTQKYLEDHAANVAKGNNSADYERFGRVVAELVLREAAQIASLADKGRETFTIAATFELKENPDKICVSGTVCVPIVGCSTAHIGG